MSISTSSSPPTKPDSRRQREESELDIIWLRDDSLEDIDNLPPPEVIAQEIVADLEAALAEFSAIAASLQPWEDGA